MNNIQLNHAISKVDEEKIQDLLNNAIRAKDWSETNTLGYAPLIIPGIGQIFPDTCHIEEIIDEINSVISHRLQYPCYLEF